MGALLVPAEGRPTDGSFCDGIVVISLTVAGLRILVDSRELPFLFNEAAAVHDGRADHGQVLGVGEHSGVA